MMDSTNTEYLTALVERVLKIEDVTHGDAKMPFLVRYRGRLRIDSIQAYDQLATSLRPLNITPLFRQDKDQHAVLLVPGLIRGKPSKAWVSILLIVLTLLSMTFTGVLYTLGGVVEGPPPTDLAGWMPYIQRSLGGGMAFAASLIAILLAHEFGHYLAGRFHNTQVTLPYFIPFPTAFGTLGAFIQMKEPPKNRRILLDIGIAGPLSGLVVAVPILILGLSLSKISPLPTSLAGAQGLQLEGNSLLYLGLKYLVFGKLLPAPETYHGVSPLLYWLQYFFTGRPFPWGGMDVMLHPVAWAGWAGLLVTALNLIPAGQLDGGHILFVLLGKRVRSLLPFILLVLIILGWFWSGWLLWAFLIFFLGRVHAEPLDQITTLDQPRILLAILCLGIFLLVFTPVPLLAVGF